MTSHDYLIRISVSFVEQVMTRLIVSEHAFLLKQAYICTYERRYMDLK